jgi:hypothetical protein
MPSWRDDLTLATARLAALEAAELSALTNDRVKSVRYEVGGVEYHEPVDVNVLDRKIYETRLAIGRLGGGAIGGGAIVLVFGG